MPAQRICIISSWERKDRKKIVKRIRKKNIFFGPQRKIEIASKNQEIMGKNAYEKAKLFSLEKAVNEFLEVIER